MMEGMCSREPRHFLVRCRCSSLFRLRPKGPARRRHRWRVQVVCEANRENEVATVRRTSDLPSRVSENLERLERQIGRGLERHPSHSHSCESEIGVAIEMGREGVCRMTRLDIVRSSDEEAPRAAARRTQAKKERVKPGVEEAAEK